MATIDVKKDVLKITRKKIRNFKEVSPATLMENFHPPHLNQTPVKLTINLTSSYKKCLTNVCQKNKSRGQKKKHKTYGSIIPYVNSEN